jgi:hypothetical protein
MNEKTKFWILLVLLAASIALLVYLSQNSGQVSAG